MNTCIIGHSVNTDGKVTHIQVNDHGCIYFVPYSFFFQEEESATFSEMNSVFEQWEDYDALTGTVGLLTCFIDGSSTFVASDGSVNYNIDSDNHISVAFVSGIEFHGSIDDFYHFMHSPLGVESQVEETKSIVVPPIPATARRISKEDRLPFEGGSWQCWCSL